MSDEDSGSRSWYEDDRFWEATREFLFTPEKLEEASEQLDALLDLMDPPTHADVLDLPCGVGRHAVELADRGHRVTAVDRTEPLLETARERAREAGVAVVDAGDVGTDDEGTVADVDDVGAVGIDDDAVGTVEFVREDMREFSRPKSFDVVLNLFTSFGYFEDPADDERTARNFYESLRPGGALAMDLTSKEVVAADFRERSWDERDGTYLLEEHEVQDGWSWMDNRWVVVDPGEGTVDEFDVSHRLYSAAELKALLERVGFEEVRVYGDHEGADYDDDAERLVVVAGK